MVDHPKPFQYWTTAAQQPVRHPVPLVTEYVLNYDEETGNETIIQTLQAGYKGNGSYGHNFTEEVYVLSGTAYCGTAKKWLKPGDYCCRTPGMVHGPFHCDEDFSALLINTRTYTGKPMVKNPSQWVYDTEGKKEEVPKA